MESNPGYLSSSSLTQLKNDFIFQIIVNGGQISTQNNAGVLIEIENAKLTPLSQTHQKIIGSRMDHWLRIIPQLLCKSLPYLCSNKGRWGILEHVTVTVQLSPAWRTFNVCNTTVVWRRTWDMSKKSEVSVEEIQKLFIWKVSRCPSYQLFQWLKGKGRCEKGEHIGKVRLQSVDADTNIKHYCQYMFILVSTIFFYLRLQSTVHLSHKEGTTSKGQKSSVRW